MPKRSSTNPRRFPHGNPIAKVTKSTSSSSPAQLQSAEQHHFPEIAAKSLIRWETRETDQILLLHDVLYPEECKRFIQFIENLPLELTPPPKKGEAERVNLRYSIKSTPFAESLFTILQPHLPEFPFPASQRKGSLTRPAHSFNSNIRLYKYLPGHRFGQHYDDSVTDVNTGAVSEWTLLIYLTGKEDGVRGGETIFHKPRGKRSTEEIRVSLRRGMALLHRHGHECLLHEGAPVLEGTKYILRSDIMFKP